jgi:hypothetical protein
MSSLNQFERNPSEPNPYDIATGTFDTGVTPARKLYGNLMTGLVVASAACSSTFPPPSPNCPRRPWLKGVASAMQLLAPC